jgi:hypothetical protein
MLFSAPAKSLLPSAELAVLNHSPDGNGAVVQFPPELVERETKPKNCAAIILVPSAEQATAAHRTSLGPIFVHVWADIEPVKANAKTAQQAVKACRPLVVYFCFRFIMVSSNRLRKGYTSESRCDLSWIRG